MTAADYVITIHGEDSDEPVVYLGGRDADLKSAVHAILEKNGFIAQIHRNEALQGTSPSNICNRGRRGAGLQLELSRGLRAHFFESLTLNGRQKPTAELSRFANAVREGVLKAIAGLNANPLKGQSGTGKPTVAEQSEIDRAATALVGGWLAKGWIAQYQQQQYHEDYVVEWVEAGELSGAKFSVQQKGHKLIRIQGSSILEQMKTKHLRYYSENARLPVFLVVVDTTRERGYYLFLQEWLDANTTPSQLRKRKHVSVRVASKNDIQDSVRFRAEVERAIAYMARKFPGTVEDAVRRDAEEVAAIDPRWDVRLDFVDSIKRYTLLPKEDIQVTLKLTGRNAELIKDSYEYGKPVTLGADGLSIEGLPIFEKLLKTAGAPYLSLTPANQVRFEVNFWSDGEHAFRMTLPGVMSQGKIGYSFVGTLPNAPFRAEMTIPNAETMKKGGAGNFTLTFNFDFWENKPIDGLAYFDQLRGFATAVANNTLIKHELVANGNRVAGGTIGEAKEILPFAYAAAVINNIAKAREIVAKLGLNVRLPKIDKMENAEFEAVEFAYGLIVGDGHVLPGVGLSATATITHDSGDPKQTIAKFSALEHEGIGYLQKGQSANIYGAIVELGDVVYSIKPVAINFAEPELQDFLEGRLISVNAKIESTEKSVLTITRQVPPPPHC